MKTTTLLTTLAFWVCGIQSIAQNWTYVGNPYINSSTSTGTYLYYGDMEMDAAGNLLVGYWEYSGVFSFAKYNGSSWSQLASPGTGAANLVDIEVNGSDYYLSYMGARGTNLYAFVKKYNGSSWSFIGDSVLIGGVGQGGSFDFTLDNNGVPTLTGLPKTVFGNKTVKQFTAGAWTTTCEIPNSAAAIFKDGSTVFDASNKLNGISGGAITIFSPPSVKYYTIGIKVDGSSCSIIGDTLYTNNANGKFRVDSLGNSYLLFNDGLTADFLSYKLVGNNWNFIADTAGANQSMSNADVSNNGKVIFSITQTNLSKAMYSCTGGSKAAMDTLNISGFAVAAIADVAVFKGSAYVLLYETKASVISDFSVMKHSLSATPTNIGRPSLLPGDINIYPNPTSGKFVIQTPGKNVMISVYNLMGETVVKPQLSNEVDLSIAPKGIYFVQINDGTQTYTRKIVVQ
ncbi:MAG: T9SS type A sorting domain-containing protein [Bacteroidia bacterium]